MSNIGDDIRRIARYEYLLKEIREAAAKTSQAEKTAISGIKSIAYLDAATMGTASQSGAVGTGKPNVPVNTQRGASAAADGATSAAAQALSAGSPWNGISNSGTTADIGSLDNTGKDGFYNTDALLADATDTFGKPPPGISDGNGDNNQTYTGDIINALTGLLTDDGTRALSVYFKDALNSFIGPSTSDDAFGQPLDPSYDVGLVWKLNITPFPFSLSLGGIQSEYIAIYPVLAFYTVTDNGGAFSSWPVSLGFGEGSYGLISGGTFVPGVSTAGSMGGTGVPYHTYVPGVGVAVGKYGQQDCGLEVGSAAACAATPPISNSWADLGLTQLGWISPLTGGLSPFTYAAAGRFLPNPFDVSVPAVYTDGSSVLDVKTLNGTKVRIGPLEAGGWYVYERDSAASNAPVGSATANSVMIVRPNRTVADRITPNQLTTLLPKLLP